MHHGSQSAGAVLSVSSFTIHSWQLMFSTWQLKHSSSSSEVKNIRLARMSFAGMMMLHKWSSGDVVFESTLSWVGSDGSDASAWVVDEVNGCKCAKRNEIYVVSLIAYILSEGANTVYLQLICCHRFYHVSHEEPRRSYLAVIRDWWIKQAQPQLFCLLEGHILGHSRWQKVYKEMLCLFRHGKLAVSSCVRAFKACLSGLCKIVDVCMWLMCMCNVCALLILTLRWHMHYDTGMH